MTDGSIGKEARDLQKKPEAGLLLNCTFYVPVPFASYDSYLFGLLENDLGIIMSEHYMKVPLLVVFGKFSLP